jgi:hypothetical protein
MKPLVIAIITSVCFSLPARAQTRAVLLVAAGPSFPIKRLNDTQQRGFDIDIAYVRGADESPIGLRFDATYDRLPGRTIAGVKQAGRRIFSGDAGVVVSLPGRLAKPYLLGGVGAYRMKNDTPGSEASTRFGFHFGLGFVLGIPGRALFIESRLQSVSQKNAKPLRYMPIVLGILF